MPYQQADNGHNKFRNPIVRHPYSQKLKFSGAIQSPAESQDFHGTVCWYS